jgi:hypothetical protein
MIQRFEDEYPECRVTPPVAIPTTTTGVADDAASSVSSTTASLISPFSSGAANPDSMSNSITLQGTDSDDEDNTNLSRVRLSRHNSDVSLAARALSIEEGQMHRMGQKVKRALISPPNGAVEGEVEDPDFEPDHIQALREKLATLKSDDLRDSVITDGWEKASDDVIKKGLALKKMEHEDPEGLKRWREELCRQGALGEEEGESAILN